MKSEYKIVDNFLPKEHFKEIQEFIIDKLPWYYSDSVSHQTSSSVIGDFYFYHLFYTSNNSIYEQNNFLKLLKPVIDLLDIKSLIRIKANLYPKTENIYEHGSHSDFFYSHKGLIYYINTNNGFTRLYDGVKIESVENRALFFDPSLKHNSSTPTNKNCRININFNYF